MRELRRHDRRATDEHEREDADEFGDEVTPGVAHGERGLDVKNTRGPFGPRVKVNGAL